MHIKKGDKIIVLTGKDKGKSGEVTKSLPKENKVVVSGINMLKIHKRARKSGEKGQIIEQASPIHASNVKLVEASQKKASKKKAK